MTVNSLPASTSLLAEIDYVGPDRDRRSDGTIGDRAHADSPSDHNPDETGNTGGAEDSDSIDEVHARDVDTSGPWAPGWSAARIVGILVALCRSLYPSRKHPLRYIIFDGYIYGEKDGFKKREYNGDDPHTGHFHASFRYGAGSGAGNLENFRGPWGIRAAREKELDEVDAADIKAIAREVVDQTRAALVNDKAGLGFQARRVPWAYPMPTDGDPDRMMVGLMAELEARLDRIEAVLEARLPASEG